jgi:hypothetical protein
MSDLNALLKRFGQGDVGEEVARENFEHNKDILLQRLDLIDSICQTTDWNARKFVDCRAELLAYLAEGRKLAGYPKSKGSAEQ